MIHFLMIFFGVILICFVIGQAEAASTCSVTKKIPKIDVAIWAGDSASGSIVRNQDQRAIACREPAFDQYTCMTYDDLKKIYSTLLKCKKWSDVVDEVAAQGFIQKNEDMHRSMLQVKPRDPGALNPLDKEPGERERTASQVDWKEVL